MLVTLLKLEFIFCITKIVALKYLTSYITHQTTDIKTVCEGYHGNFCKKGLIKGKQWTFSQGVESESQFKSLH